MFVDKVCFLIVALGSMMLAGCSGESEKKKETLLSTKCSMDMIGGERRNVVWVKPGVVSFRGWAADSSNTVPANLNVVLTGLTSHVSETFRVSSRHDRPDVVKHFNQAGLLKSGFKVDVDVSALEKGTYAVSLQMPVDQAVIACVTKKSISIY